MINNAVLTGRLTKDVELRYTPNGVAVGTFTLAIDRRTTNQQGERETDFIPVVVWRQQAELCSQYLKKGQQAAVVGRIQVRNYENGEGRRVYVTEVVAEQVQFLSAPTGSNASAGSNATNSNATHSNSSSSQQSNENPFAGDQRPIDISDDDLPF
ncbi:single-stranded DNA-binding protein (plasmid) [Aneurinibacillus sp. Ricciae_BoGa-3]|uniref:single-stranded DNA-binding protein n=1 Tax=Aneurinibacillus sp. Ricciae_BoGa-3 TaxID=3022697 RepID=UPI0023407E95|nr:single-stranded DNA-binding protein [Aneurinibacillus sp. Ricciae_BoGa-3]WCK57631.1 single-stranded DNA-binding protein [Aneurinibacillus sp. Ricciae_BoGa-3]